MSDNARNILASSFFTSLALGGGIGFGQHDNIALTVYTALFGLNGLFTYSHWRNKRELLDIQKELNELNKTA